MVGSLLEGFAQSTTSEANPAFRAITHTEAMPPSKLIYGTELPGGRSVMCLNRDVVVYTQVKSTQIL